MAWEGGLKVYLISYFVDSKRLGPLYGGLFSILILKLYKLSMVVKKSCFTIKFERMLFIAELFEKEI